MRLKFSIVLLILISFLNIGAFSGRLVNDVSFTQLESQCLSRSEFVENGVKVQYKTKIDEKTEEEKISDCFLKHGLKINSSSNLEFYNDKVNVEADLWNDGLYTYVNVTLMNKDASYMTLELQNIIRELIDEDSEEVQYFRYYKGRVNDEGQNDSRNTLEEIMSESILNEADILELYNGYAGNATIKGGKELNFALCRYDTGTYIIIATPIIFAAY
ncbi:MAG: hypothetical protein Q4F66_03580 [Clostridium sp.]|nr:hypothetical protein [Clostridium sp.]